MFIAHTSNHWPLVLAPRCDCRIYRISIDVDKSTYHQLSPIVRYRTTESHSLVVTRIPRYVFDGVVIATKHQIAVLGLEAFEVRNDGLQTVYLADSSTYILFTGDWRAYVAALNAEAERWLKEHRLGENHGYILTSTSEREFARNKARFR